MLIRALGVAFAQRFSFRCGNVQHRFFSEAAAHSLCDRVERPARWFDVRRRALVSIHQSRGSLWVKKIALDAAIWSDLRVET